MDDPKIWTAEEADALLAAATTSGPWNNIPIFTRMMDGPVWQEASKGNRALILAAPDLAASVSHHARRADEAERQRDHLAEMLVKRTQDAVCWRNIAECGGPPSAAFLMTWWRASHQRDALVQMLGAETVERAEVNLG